MAADRTLGRVGARGRLAAWLVLGVVASGCRGCGGESEVKPGASAPGSATSARAAGVNVPRLAPGPPSRPSPLSSDPLWTEAAAGDTLDLARLANREGAAGLIEGLELGGTPALTALGALPEAEDAELALRRLCELLPAVPPGELEPLLRAVHGVVARPPRQAEKLDPGGYAECGRALDRLVQSGALSPALRDLALSARQLAAEHGVRE
jgi:hypothetical protein